MLGRGAPCHCCQAGPGGPDGHEMTWRLHSIHPSHAMACRRHSRPQLSTHVTHIDTPRSRTRSDLSTRRTCTRTQRTDVHTCALWIGQASCRSYHDVPTHSIVRCSIDTRRVTCTRERIDSMHRALAHASTPALIFGQKNGFARATVILSSFVI